MNNNEYNQSFMTSSRLRKHLKTIDNKQKSFNDYNKCDKIFDSKSNFKSNNKRYFGEKTFKTHNKEKPFICDFEKCDIKFDKSSYLKNRLKRHLGLKAFKCNFKKCVKSFIFNYELERHIWHSFSSGSIATKIRDFRLYKTIGIMGNHSF